MCFASVSVEQALLVRPVCASSLAVVSVRSWSSGIGRNLGGRLGKSAAGVVERGSGGGSTAYIVGVVDHLYLATRLPLWLTLSSYASTTPAVLAGTFIPAYVSWSYVGHIVATVPDKSPTTHCQGHYSLVSCCICPDTPPVTSCQGSRGTVRQLAATSTLTRRLSPTDMGQGHWSRASLARQLCCTARCQGGQLASRRTARGYLEVGSGVRRRPDVAKS
ncbi:hypothetical protein B296_00025780 [Ensete ventricosum]|uniref:Uncharacterized protein n=1 Tax=Ensete ventricosum TaxID=4639 RepID=A0A426XNV1_ENSVE|nr:hypothetical protein B296_00025780 [Ensete ventricosum]